MQRGLFLLARSSPICFSESLELQKSRNRLGLRLPPSWTHLGEGSASDCPMRISKRWECLKLIRISDPCGVCVKPSRQQSCTPLNMYFIDHCRVRAKAAPLLDAGVPHSACRVPDINIQRPCGVPQLMWYSDSCRGRTKAAPQLGTMEQAMRSSVCLESI